MGTRRTVRSPHPRMLPCPPSVSGSRFPWIPVHLALSPTSLPGASKLRPGGEHVFACCFFLLRGGKEKTDNRLSPRPRERRRGAESSGEGAESGGAERGAEQSREQRRRERSMQSSREQRGSRAESMQRRAWRRPRRRGAAQARRRSWRPPRPRGLRGSVVLGWSGGGALRPRERERENLSRERGRARRHGGSPLLLLSARAARGGCSERPSGNRGLRLTRGSRIRVEARLLLRAMARDAASACKVAADLRRGDAVARSPAQRRGRVEPPMCASAPVRKCASVLRRQRATRRKANHPRASWICLSKYDVMGAQGLSCAHLSQLPGCLLAGWLAGWLPGVGTSARVARS